MGHRPALLAEARCTVRCRPGAGPRPRVHRPSASALPEGTAARLDAVSCPRSRRVPAKLPRLAPPHAGGFTPEPGPGVCGCNARTEALGCCSALPCEPPARSRRLVWRSGPLLRSHPPDRSPTGSSTRRNATLWENSSSSGLFSPRESVASSRRFRPFWWPDALLGFQPLQGIPLRCLGPVLPPALLSQAWPGTISAGAGLAPCGSPSVRCSRLPLRVSENNEAGRSLARSTGPREVRRLVVQPRN
jgi:hypothetical protein